MTFKEKLIACAVVLTIASQADAMTAEQALAEGRFEEAIELASSDLERQPSDPGALIVAGRAHLSLNQPDVAEEHFSRAAAADPESVEAHYWSGAANGTLAANASVFRAGKFAKRSLASFRKALELDPTHIEAHKGLITYHLSAPRIMGGSRKEARQLASDLTALDRLEGQLAMARILDASGDDAGSTAIYDALAREFADDPRALVAIGFREQSAERYDAAHAAFARAAEGRQDTDAQRTSYRMALYQLGRTAVFSGQQVEAGIGALERYLDAPQGAGLPEHAWARFRLGKLYELHGNADAAAESYRLARASTDDKDLLRQLKGVVD